MLRESREALEQRVYRIVARFVLQLERLVQGEPRYIDI